MPDVIVVGSANADIIARVGDLPAPGQTLLGTEAAIRPGGKGANQAVAAARLGASTRMVAALGGDGFAAPIRDALVDAGVDVSGVSSVSGLTTGLALIVVAADGENTVVVAPGANAALDADAVADLRFDAGDILALQLEIPIDTCLAAAAAAHAAGARVQLNAAPLTKPGDPALIELLARTHVLVLNETEAASLATHAGSAAPQDIDGWRALAARIGTAATVITLGARGAVGFDGEHTWWQPPFPADVVDTTGAGDAFCGALAHALAAGYDLREAVRRACAAGALATERLGAQAALPTAAQVDELLAGEGE
jgi:ribokinase